MNLSLPGPLLAVAAALALASLPLLRAQHLHGGAPAPLPAAARPAAVTFGKGITADPALQAFFRDFAEALRTHDGKPFVPRLAANFVVPGYESDDMRAGFVYALTMIPSPEEIIITAVEPQSDGGRLIRTSFRFPQRTARREFLLSSDYHLVRTTLIAMRRVEVGASSR